MAGRRKKAEFVLLKYTLSRKQKRCHRKPWTMLHDEQGVDSNELHELQLEGNLSNAYDYRTVLRSRRESNAVTPTYQREFWCSHITPTERLAVTLRRPTTQFSTFISCTPVGLS